MGGEGEAVKERDIVLIRTCMFDLSISFSPGTQMFSWMLNVCSRQ